MSLTADGALSNIPSSTTESRRATTPSKLFTRQTTPQRSTSAPRSNSNTKERIVNDINLDPRVIHTGPPRPISVRRQRRWENKNLFGLDDHTKSKEDRILEALEREDVAKEGIPFEISWRSTLSELMKPKNHQLLHDFLSCKDDFGTKKVPKKVNPADQNDYEVAEEAWIKVEKRIRAATMRSYASSEVIQVFLADLERVILHFAHTQQVLSANQLCDELTKELAQPISIDKSGNLVIPFHDSAFRRLLVHGVAQFYGLQSNSVKAKGEANKSCLVKAPRRAAPSSSAVSAAATAEGTAASASQQPARRTEAVVRCLSLVQFLSLRRETGHAAEEAPEIAAEGGATLDPLVPAPTLAAPIPAAMVSALGHPALSRAALYHLQRKLAKLSVADAAVLTTARMDAAAASPASVPAACVALLAPGFSVHRQGDSPGDSPGLRLTSDSYDCVELDADGSCDPVLVSPQPLGTSGRALSTDSDTEYVVVPR